MNARQREDILHSSTRSRVRAALIVLTLMATLAPSRAIVRRHREESPPLNVSDGATTFIRQALAPTPLFSAHSRVPSAYTSRQAAAALRARFHGQR
jgi:hypothetical protein